MSDIKLSPETFGDFFFDVRKHRPKKGQIMARYSAVGELVDEGPLKRDLIKLLIEHPNGGEAAAKVMRKLGGAIERDSYRVPREMVEDLVGGFTDEQVAAKPYKFILEHFFYTHREYVPTDDPHWSMIEILNISEFDGTTEASSEEVLAIDAVESHQN